MPIFPGNFMLADVMAELSRGMRPWQSEAEGPIASREDFEKRWAEAHAKAEATGALPPHLKTQWMIDANDGQLIGRITHTDISESEGCRSCEIGLVIWERELWGQGYGTDAVVTLLRYLFGEKELQRVECATWSGNAAMIRCAEKCGFRREGVRRGAVFNHRDGKYYDSVLFGMQADEFSHA